MEFNFAWPPKELSPNIKPHWAVKGRAVKRYRENCYNSCVVQNLGSDFKEQRPDKIHLFIEFYPPTKRSYDDDNCLSRFKAGRDGLAEYLGIDDKCFISHPLVKESVKNGLVKVRVEFEY